MADKEFQFKCRIVRCVFDSEDFKVYAADIDTEKYPNVKRTKYGTVSVCGEIHSLGLDQMYEVYAAEENGKNGYSYRVKNIKRDRPNSSLDMQIFLGEILTPKQAQTLWDVYPDIVERVIENRLDDIDLNKTNGIKEFTFNKIKEKIIDNYCLVELVDEFKGLLSLSMLKKLYEKYASIQVIRNKMRTNPYKCLCDISNIGFITADKLLLEIDKVSKENIKNNIDPIIDFENDLIDSKQRCMSCVFYLLQENENNGHTKMSIIELKEQCDKLVPACCHHFVSVMKDDGIYCNKDKKEVAINKTYETEKYIAQSILDGLKIKNEWDYETDVYKTCDDGIELVQQQVDAIKNLCKHNISIINGPAGTGKTYATKAIIKLLDDKDKSYKLFSPTGRAAKILKSYTGKLTSTIHRGLGYIPPNTWTYCKEFKLDVGVLIIDEISMCDIYLFRKVIDAIDFNKTKLVLIGDNAQLPSVSCGNLLHDLMESKTVPTATLKIVFRYNEGGLAKVATDVRQMKKYLNSDIKDFITFGENKDYMFVQSSSEKIIKNLIPLYQKLLSQGFTPDDIIVLSAQNKGVLGTVALNNHIQKIANKNSTDETADKTKIGEITYFVDDIVIQTKNNYHARLMVEDEFFGFQRDTDDTETFIANGETGRILEIGKFDVIIDFNGEKIKYGRDEMQEVKLGYSISCHRSQGGSFRVVIFLSPSQHVFMLNSNIIYVGLTRTIERCFHIGDATLVNKAVKKKENLKRNTFLQELLKEMVVN